jgi:acetone carboxylase gamma subunit
MSRISPTLIAKGGMICCLGCGHGLSKTGTSWKTHATMTSVPFHTLPGASAGLHAGVLLRQFGCPKCWRLLDSETALPEDPFLEDIVVT